jgi:NAD(P)-dependent dehydrogenase (short-subunit alcohol dehydrogenase family)
MATDCDSMRTLATSLGAELRPLPAVTDPGTFDAWRARMLNEAFRQIVIVSVWDDESRALPLVEVEADVWERRFEWPFLLWNVALGAAARICRAGGAIVALVQTPSALDASGFCAEMSAADGVVALARSLAASEGTRGIRANVVTTPLRLVDRAGALPPPPLETFPGRLEIEVAGAIRLASSSDAIGLTGRVFAADGGRALA